MLFRSGNSIDAFGNYDTLRLHRAPAKGRAVPGVLVYMFAPQARWTVVRVAVSYDAGSTAFAYKVFSSFGETHFFLLFSLYKRVRSEYLELRKILSILSSKSEKYTASVRSTPVLIGGRDLNPPPRKTSAHPFVKEELRITLI